MSHEYRHPELSANAKFAAWVVLGGLMFLGFGFGLWAGTRPPEPKEVAKAAPRVETPKPAPKPAEVAKKVEPAPEPKAEPKPEPVAKKPDPPTPKPEPVVVAKKPDPPKDEPKAVTPKAGVTEVSFTKQLFPVIRTHCLSCHGDPSIKGGLDLRTVEKIKKGGDSGDAVKPGDPSKGSLWAAIEGGEMPPPGKPRLSDAEKKLFRDWIESG
ncbi:MAG TPA: c-type cytochrome domain-containing protein, partial [Gemmataceae bacterium]|nr:c-type cytochrome domain-containing protein [Gemmataceae bacterium]